jgi:hypothetical protein
LHFCLFWCMAETLSERSPWYALVVWLVLMVVYLLASFEPEVGMVWYSKTMVASGSSGFDLWCRYLVELASSKTRTVGWWHCAAVLETGGAEVLMIRSLLVSTMVSSSNASIVVMLPIVCHSCAGWYALSSVNSNSSSVSAGRRSVVCPFGFCTRFHMSNCACVACFNGGQPLPAFADPVAQHGPAARSSSNNMPLWTQLSTSFSSRLLCTGPDFGFQN